MTRPVTLIVTVPDVPDDVSDEQVRRAIQADLGASPGRLWAVGFDADCTVTGAEQDGVHHTYGLSPTSYPVYREVRP